jgi:hypothetical protein
MFVFNRDIVDYEGHGTLVFIKVSAEVRLCFKNYYKDVYTPRPLRQNSCLPVWYNKTMLKNRNAWIVSSVTNFIWYWSM